jgi:hypothetical protein
VKSPVRQEGHLLPQIELATRYVEGRTPTAEAALDD